MQRISAEVRHLLAEAAPEGRAVLGCLQRRCRWVCLTLMVLVISQVVMWWQVERLSHHPDQAADQVVAGRAAGFGVYSVEIQD